MGKTKQIVGEQILKNIILQSFIDNKVIGVCSDCIDEKVEKPYHFLSGYRDFLGVIEVRLPLREGYQYYNHSLCNNHYKIRQEEKK